jgi:6-phosphogluconolactonase
MRRKHTGPEIVVRSFAARVSLDEALAARIGSACTEPSPANEAVMLSGGETPRPAYALVAARAPRARPGLLVCYTDERYVPSHSEASNHRSTRTLLEAMRIPQDGVMRVRTELPLEEAANDYDARLALLLEHGSGIGLGVFGLGDDGHTASLFSVEDLERARGRRAIAVSRPDGMDGVSITPAVIARVADPLVVVAGRNKRSAVAAFVRGDRELIASRAFAGCARVEVWVDADAYPQ